jgi:hypothetical protein
MISRVPKQAFFALALVAAGGAVQPASAQPAGTQPTDAPATGAQPTGAPATGAQPTGAPATGAPLTDPFVEQTATINRMESDINHRVEEIMDLRAKAASQGEAVRVSCIDDKLQRARKNQAQYKVDRALWPATQSDPQAQLKLLSKLRLGELYSAAYVQDARACVDAKAIGTLLKVHVEGVPQSPPGSDPVRPPLFERPPLASAL